MDVANTASKSAEDLSWPGTVEFIAVLVFFAFLAWLIFRD